ncbi:N-acetyltransferase [Helicobacter kayseriensis]|uniref:N-acetyltransferase n=1 Tax=Helicobacter kayseriensis TaxID=2905877 RepID=UPI001E35DD91|nr:N-acetyltransferase [Helicobacter kayseriensis]MCE3046722.1 N-acetyltransferase [Helicobacter kayseriensis]MCE3047976.1 N-acetyltransferase [Helicobacter kayseriensis]
MLALVEPEVQKGNILPRSEEEMANTIRSYVVARDGERIVGFCALYIYTQELAEVRSLIVDEQYHNRGIGKELVRHIEQEGRALGIQTLLVLTYKEHFFQKLGFYTIQKSEIPNHKIWTDCIKCKHFPQCNEVALLKSL